jgi:hypothetical protein
MNCLKHVPAQAGTEEGDSQGWGQESPRSVDPGYPRLCGSGALKLILEPLFEADFQSKSYGYRPKRPAHQAVNRVAQAR